MATTDTPIIGYQPGGGVPIPGGPPVIPGNTTGVEQLVNGQAYVDVVFGSRQNDADWSLVECFVLNEIDATPLNIWPGIITDRTTTGFQLQLNGMPDSNHYYLHWAISGIIATPTVATSYRLFGPSSGQPSDAIFTVALFPGNTLTGSATVTLHDGGAGGTFAPATVILSSSTPSQIVTYSPATYGAVTISATNNFALIDPANIVFTVIAPTYTLTGPSSGNSGVPSTNFTLQLFGALTGGSMIVTPSASGGGGGGTFTPTTVTLDSVTTVGTFTYTPASGGSKTISVTNNRGLANPASLTYLVAIDPLSIAGCKIWLKADALALADGAQVHTWPDSSGLANDFTDNGSNPIFKTAIVNGKPVVRFLGSNYVQRSMVIADTNYTLFAVVNAASTGGSATILANGNVGGGQGVLQFRRDTADWNHTHFDTTYTVIKEISGVVASVWNVMTADWDGANIHIWRNSTLKATGASTTTLNIGTMTSIGSDRVFNVNPWDGDIAEVLYYNSALSSTDRTSIENYLKGKYGIP